MLNSNFDLQLLGDLGNGLQVAAAISDDNIPIQPEGNTQVLQEFDRVFIEVSKNDQSIIAGDYILNRPNSYFLNYLKKIKGLGAHSKINLGEGREVNNSAHIASSRGKFARQTLDIREGNQGPYRLQGNNNERFIIVLSGSERVYYNGELLVRGFNNDYIIDYNTADITFSPKRLVSKETRVIVEFEYTDQNYFRTLYAVQSDFKFRKGEINVNFYSEQDSRNTTGQIDLDSTSIQILRQAGDDPNASFRSGIRAFDFENSSLNVGYRKEAHPDFPNDPDKFILRYTDDRDSIEVAATFTEVGIGEGSYQISLLSGVNGRVYEYVGEGLGAYEPQIALIAPEQRRAFSIGGKYKLSRHLNVQGELALSDFDNNRLSSIDDQDNIGIAGNFGYNTSFNLSDSLGWKVVHAGKIELIESDFSPLNPYRTAEFTRDWNTEFQFEDREVFILGDVGLKHRTYGGLTYELSRYQIANLFDGLRHGLNIDYKKKGFVITGRPSMTTTKDLDKSTQFIRPNFIAKQKISYLDDLQLIMNYEGEYNRIEDLETGELSESAYSFDYLKSGFSTNTERDLQFSFSYNKRVDRFSNKIDIVPSIDIQELETALRWDYSENSQFDFTLKTRDFKVTRPELLPNETSKKTILGGLNYSLNSLGGGLIASTNYQINSGQEPRLEFVFQKVENALGDYVYIGSDTATIQNVNDFRFDPSNPLSEYIRIAIPNNEFIRTNNLNLNQSLRLEGARLVKVDSIRNSNWRKLAQKFSTNSNIRIQNKSLDEGGSTVNPIGINPNDSSLVAYSFVSTQAIFFNRSNPKYDIALTFRNNGNKSNQINGFEERGLADKEIRIRWNVVNNSDLILTSNQGIRSFDSQIFDLRDFNIEYFRIRPELNIRLGTKMRIISRYTYDIRKQMINQKEEATSHDLSIDFNYRQKSSLSLDAGISFVRIDYTGEDNAPIEYDLLDGLKDGANFIWDINLTKRLGNNIDLTLAYDGRKSGDNPTVHVGRVQAKATF